MHIEQLWRSMRNVGYLICGMVLVSGLLRAAVGEAATYYVAKTGSDNNSCAQGQSQSTPKLTIQSSLTCLQAGDTLYIKAGTYAEEITNPPGGTSWSNPVTIAGFPGETVTIRPDSGAVRVVNFLSASSSYIILDNLHLDATNVWGDVVKIESTTGLGNSHHIRIQNSELFNAGVSAGGGIVQGVLICDQCSGNEFINDNIHHNGDVSQAHFSHGMYITSANNLVENSLIHDNAGYGIHLYGSANIQNNIIRGNRIYNHTHDNFGIIVASGDNNFVYNNLIYNNLAGIQIDYGASNTRVWNNTIYNNHGVLGAGVWLGDSYYATVQNNIIFNNDINTVSGGTGTTADHNLTSDPSFVDAAQANFQLQASSAAIDAGTTVAPITTDYAGVSRLQGASYDIGAYEYTGNKLPSPSKLRVVSTN